MRRVHVDRLAGMLEDGDHTEVLLDTSDGEMSVAFRRRYGTNMLDAVAGALLTALEDDADDGTQPTPTSLEARRATGHLLAALAILKREERSVPAYLVELALREVAIGARRRLPQ